MLPSPIRLINNILHVAENHLVYPQKVYLQYTFHFDQANRFFQLPLLKLNGVRNIIFKILTKKIWCILPCFCSTRSQSRKYFMFYDTKNHHAIDKKDFLTENIPQVVGPAGRVSFWGGLRGVRKRQLCLITRQMILSKKIKHNCPICLTLLISDTHLF